jgi:hypothetical protein
MTLLKTIDMKKMYSKIFNSLVAQNIFFNPSQFVLNEFHLKMYVGMCEMVCEGP